MIRRTQSVIFAAAVITHATLAYGQVDAAAPAQSQPKADAPPAAQPSGPETVVAPPPSAAATEPPAIPSATEERLTTVEAKADGLSESLAETRTSVERMDKLRFSGYIQGRFEHHADSERGVDANNKPTQTSQFLVRRARLKATYSEKVAEFVLQIDVAGKAPSLKDAEATFIEPWSSWGVRLTVGQFKVPFGYEVLQSSVDREMPERTRLARALFPGERDRGLRLQLEHEFLRFSGAVLNGNAIDDPIYTVNDQNAYKDLAGRVGVDLDHIVVGVSGYEGRALATKLGDSKAMPPTEATYKTYARRRFGVDAQVYLDVPSVGGLAVKGELVRGRQLGNPVSGFYVSVLQTIGTSLGVFGRFDQYDPDTDTTGDRFDTIGAGAQYFFSGNLKASAIYEHPMAEEQDKSDDIVTCQLQAMF